MSTLLQQLCSVQAIGWTLLHSVWLGVLFWVIHVLLQAALRRWDSRVRYAAACACMLLLVASLAMAWLLASVVPLTFQPKLWQSEIQPLQLTARGNYLGLPDAPEASPLTRWLAMVDPFLPYVVALWGAGILLHVTWTASAVAVLHRRATHALGVNDGPLLEAFGRLSQRLLQGRSVLLRRTDFVSIPATFGWLRPVVLLPFWVVGQMSVDEVRCIIAHELAHIRRRDYLINLVQAFIETAMFFHPLVRRISAQIRHLREECCDDLAIEALDGDRRSYGRALVAFEKLRHLRETTAAYDPAQTPSGAMELSMELSGGSIDDRIDRLVRLQHGGARRGYAQLLGALLAITLCSSMAMGYARVRVEEQELIAFAELHTAGEAVYRLLDADVENPRFVDAIVEAVQTREQHGELTLEQMRALVDVVSRGGSPRAMLQASSGSFGAASMEKPIPGSSWKGFGARRWHRLAKSLYAEAERMPPGEERARFVRAAVLIVTHTLFTSGDGTAGVIPFKPNFPELSGLPPLTLYRLQIIVSMESKRLGKALIHFAEWKADPARPLLPLELRSVARTNPGIAWQLENWRSLADQDDPRAADIQAFLETLPYKFGKETRRTPAGHMLIVPQGDEGTPVPLVP